jgi:hypothetical protein
MFPAWKPNWARSASNGRQLNRVHRGEGVFRIALGHPNLEEDKLEILFGNRAVKPTEFGLGIASIQDEAGISAYHIPEGSLLVYDQPGPASCFPARSTRSNMRHPC